jgi:signal transduction histidine kinase/CheY-like chemotaxis protein/streptogramin lyase
MGRIAFAAALLALLVSAAPRAQVPDAPLIRRLGTADGLPSSFVIALAQDRAGYLWLGTADGLARYDGVQFVAYQHDPADPASLRSNSVQSLHIDARDRIWVGTEGGGLSVMEAGRKGFRHYHPDTDPRFALEDVWAIGSAPDGALWFGGFGGGVYRFDPERDQLQPYRHVAEDPDSLAANHVLAIEFDPQGRPWIGTSAGLDRYVDGHFEHLRAGEAGLSAALVTSLDVEPDGTLWIGTVAGYDRRAPDGSLTRAEPGGPFALGRAAAVLRDRHGTHWFASPVGVHHLAQGRMQHFAGTAGPSGASRGINVFDLLEDHEGGLWFASQGSGVLRLPPNWRNFAVLDRDAGDRGGLGPMVPRAAAEALDGGYWVVSESGVLEHVDPLGRVTRHLEDAPRLPERNLWSVLEAPRGVVWIGHHGGLSRFEPARARLRSWSRSDAVDAVPAGHVDLLRVDPAGDLWLVANGAAVQRRAPDGRVLATWTPGDGGFPDGDIDELGFAPDGSLWLACGGGLFRFDAAAQRFAPVPGSPQARIFGFDFTRDGSLWLQRLGALEHYRIGASLELIDAVGAAEGLPAVEAGGVRVDRADDVWMTSNRGLFRLRPATRELRAFGVRDGLPTPEFGNRPPLRTRGGVIAAGTVEGLVIFDPARLQEVRSSPRLRLERISLLRDGVAREVDPSLPLALRHDDRELHVAARLLSFADPQSHRYRFRLRGHDQGWIDGDASGERVFSSLAPGDYRLEVVAANADGVWTAPPLGLDIVVSPPWWATAWARAGFALLALALLLLAARLYRDRLRRRHAAQLVLRQREWALRASEAKSSFLATLGHEIRTPMTGVLGMTELLLRTPLAGRQRDYAEAIQRSGELMLRLVNDALDLARIEAGRLELDEAALDPAALLHEAAEFLRPLAERKGLALRTRLAPGLPAAVRGDALRLKQILLNLGSNAIKFTERGEVELALAPGQAPFSLVFGVRDSGPGLGEAQRARLFQRFSQADGAETTRRYGGSGLGLAISQELAAAMGGGITVESAPGAGACFQVSLPLAPCDPVPAPALASPSGDASGTDSDSRSVLLVEDDPTVAQVVAGLLESRGHRVQHAPHGLAALTLLETDAFDLAFVDLDLPGVDGLALAGLLRSRVPALPLVALTARADPDAEPQAIAAGMVAFLRKPASGEQLEESLRGVLAPRAPQ